jgi:hypothetical protein
MGEDARLRLQPQLEAAHVLDDQVGRHASTIRPRRAWQELA